MYIFYVFFNADPYEETKDCWLAVVVFIGSVVGALVIGILGTIMVFLSIRKHTDSAGIVHSFHMLHEI